MALRTPATDWMASATCRAQFPQVIPLIRKVVTDEFYGGRRYLSNRRAAKGKIRLEKAADLR